MTKEQIEDFMYDLIRFLKKWDFWESSAIDYNGRFYSDWETGTYPGGFRDMPDIQVCDTDPLFRKGLLRDGLIHENAVLIVMWEGSGIDSIVFEGFCKLRLSNLSDDAKKYVIEKEELLELELDDYDFPILDDTDFDSYDEYLELELEMEDEIAESILSHLDCRDVLCIGEVPDHILQEMQEIFEKHHMDYSEIGCWDGIACYPMKDNRAD